jgi:uncharacterized protein with GYD domain
MTIGYLGKAHRIHVAVNNHQDEHQSTVLDMSSMITDQQFSILIDPGAIESFISSVVLKRIKVKEVKKDDFRYVELASGAKEKFGGKIKDFIINFGEFVACVNLFLTTLGSYDMVIEMDWLESHDVILNC